MSNEVRPFRGFRLPRLVREVVEWRGELPALAELAKELEFRQGKVAAALKATVLRQLEAAEWERRSARQARWNENQSLANVLRNATPPLRSAVTLLQAAGYPVIARSASPVKHRRPLRRAIAWNDGGRITRETGAPGSPERCRLLIEVFTRAITMVRAEGLACGGSAASDWPQDRALVVREMQKMMRQARQPV
jgi:hypothetical protein